MIRKLREEDRKTTLAFLEVEAAINLFIIGDIECFGFDEDFQELWGCFNAYNQLQGVLLRFNENYIPYYRSRNFDTKGFKNIIASDSARKIISGKEGIVKEFKALLRSPNEKSMYFCELKEGSKLKPCSNTVKIAREEDAVRVYELLEEIEEFQVTDTNSVERIQRLIATKSGRIYYIEDNQGKLLTVAQTTAENFRSAMVVGVATRKGYREQGLMSQCLSKLCHDVLLEGKSLCLFYDNPKAGSVYHGIGFESIDRWMMLAEGKCAI
ncbi:MAG: GNAT family N-acetyltransferase [Thermotaleaceae bacterium]